ncbi:unnamed protein product [Adineta steineri]|uniref:Uncharacterized protein n=2 Tax=Adineta steineri TaxID=433720 RepID=A0A815JP30_9BILA|nr:unnamed protein product [Adineta steineri]
MDILFPTLMACSFDCEATRTILQTEMSLDLIVNFIQIKLTETKMTNEDTFAFYMIFPRDECNNALKYYRPISKLTTNQIESHDDEEKENIEIKS